MGVEEWSRSKAHRVPRVQIFGAWVRVLRLQMCRCECQVMAERQTDALLSPGQSRHTVFLGLFILAT